MERDTEVAAFGSENIDDQLDDQLLDTISRSDNTLDTVTESPDGLSSTEPENAESQHSKLLEGIDTKNWGECIEFDCPTDSVCIKVDKLLAQAVQASAEPASGLAGQDLRMKELFSKVRDCEDALSRFGILFEQAVQRIDGQLQHMVSWQRSASRTQEDQKRRTDALIAEVGVDVVKARIQQMERDARVQQMGRPQQGFGGQRPRDLQFPMDMGSSPNGEYVPRHPMNENSYNRRGRGNRRGGRY
jgi:hypothetical protein